MRPLVLVTNDDGVLSPGLKAAVEAVSDLGQILLVAPRNQQTAMSRSFPKGEDVGSIERFSFQIGGVAYSAHGVHGSPAQAVSHALLELADRKPDLCLCGINYGENVGTGLFPSGTIGAALEASTYGVPALAINLEASIEMQHSSNYDWLDWRTAKHFARYFCKLILKEGLPESIGVLNVNIPSDAKPDTPIRRTRQSMQDYFVFKKPGVRDLTKGYRLQTEVRLDRNSLEPDSDIQTCIIDRLVSVTPITQDMTARVDWGRPEWKFSTTDSSP